MLSVQDYRFYAVFKKQSVYDESTDLSYFTFSTTNFTDPADSVYDVANGVAINIKTGVHLTGKISLPTYAPNGLPVIALGTGFKATENSSVNTEGFINRDITHIFWYRTDNKEPLLRTIPANTFAGAVGETSVVNNVSPVKLKYIELPESLRVIENSAFFYINSLDINLIELPSHLYLIGSSAFNGAFNKTITGEKFNLPGSVYQINNNAFA